MDPRHSNHPFDPTACADVRMLLSARRDGEVSELESVAADRHLDTCEPCLDFDRRIARTSRQLRAAPRLTPSRALWSARPPRPLRRPLAALAVAASLVVAGLVGAEVSALEAGSPHHAQHTVRVAALDAHSLQFSLHQQRLRALRGAPDLTNQMELLRDRLG